MLNTNSRTLIADAGGTSTTWCLSLDNVFSTDGINPFQQSEEDIFKIVHFMKTTCLDNSDVPQVSAIRFYGAGCTPEKTVVVKRALSNAFDGTVEDIEVHSDLLGAARGLCGTDEGVACILGTGSNSCFYDGEKIVRNTPALGYILGDEGGGAVLGKMFLNALLKGRLDKGVADAFFDEYGMNQAAIIERVYRQPLANRFLASFTKFISEYRDNPTVNCIIKDNFANFLNNNVKPYDCQILNFTGSIAYHYAEILREVAEQHGYEIGKITQSPLEGLAEYHAKNH